MAVVVNANESNVLEESVEGQEIGLKLYFVKLGLLNKLLKVTALSIHKGHCIFLVVRVANKQCHNEEEYLVHLQLRVVVKIQKSLEESFESVFQLHYIIPTSLLLECSLEFLL